MLSKLRKAATFYNLKCLSPAIKEGESNKARIVAYLFVTVCRVVVELNIQLNAELSAQSKYTGAVKCVDPIDLTPRSSSSSRIVSS